MRQTHYYEIYEGDQDGVRVVCRCGSEEDARMMMLLAPKGKNRSWVKVQFLPPDTVETTAEEVKLVELPHRRDLPEGKQVPFVVRSMRCPRRAHSTRPRDNS